MRPATRNPLGATTKTLALVTLALVALITAMGCSAAGGQDRVRVVVTTNILGDITRNVVGDQAPTAVLMKPDADPHSFGISAQQAADLERADLIVHNGLGLEEGALRAVRTAGEAGVATVPVAERVEPIRYASDESQGQLDPHFWTDPSRVARAVDVIAQQVIEHVEGVDAAVVHANAARYRGQIEALDAEMTGLFDRIPEQQRELVTNHHVFGYFAQRYGFEVTGAVVPSGTTLASPSASDLSALADAVRGAGVRAIFADSSQPDRLARVLAEHAGLDVEVIPLHSESLSPPGEGAGTYLEMTRANAEAITRGLTG